MVLGRGYAPVWRVLPQPNHVGRSLAVLPEARLSTRETRFALLDQMRLKICLLRNLSRT